MLRTNSIEEIINGIEKNTAFLSGDGDSLFGSTIKDKAVNGNPTRAKVANGSQLAEYIEGLDYENIGPSVSVGSFSDYMLSNVTAICRRRFKKKDIIAFVDLKEGEDFESGVIFTESGIFYWSDNGDEIENVEYNAISSVDYDEESVCITTINSSMNIFLGEDAEEEKYPRYMYNFIMDIVDYINGESEENAVVYFDEEEEE